MKNWKKYASLLLALVMCLSLAACGGGNGDNDDDIIDGVEEIAPDTIENLVTDTSVEFDYSAYMGTWLGEDDSVLVMEHIDGITNSERFRLNGADQALLASGNIQYVEEYGYVYLYNEHDAIAHISWFYEDDTLYIDSFGTFTKVSGDVPGEVVGDDVVAVDPADAPQTIFDSTTLSDPVEYDYSAFLGTWTGKDASTIVVEEDSGEGAPYILYYYYSEPYTNGVLCATTVPSPATGRTPLYWCVSIRRTPPSITIRKIKCCLAMWNTRSPLKATHGRLSRASTFLTWTATATAM